MRRLDWFASHRREVWVLGLWLSVGAVLGWLTAVCLFGQVGHSLTPSQIVGDGVVGRVWFPRLVWLGPGDPDLEIFEEERRLGPRVQGAESVRELLGGAYAIGLADWSFGSSGVLHFSASDGSAPRFNGRRYRVSYPRRFLPASMALLLGSWFLLPLAALRYSSKLRRPSIRARPPLNTSGWSLAVMGGLYSLFVVQAWLPASNDAWFLALTGVGLAPFLARLGRCEVEVPLWSPWLAGFLVWLACTTWGGSSFVSMGQAAVFFAVTTVGLIVFLGWRGSLDRYEGRRSGLLVGLFLAAVGLSLARDAGCDLAGIFASLGLTSVWPGRLVNPWTTKFVGHWLLVLGWCAVLALERGRRNRVRGVLPLAALGVLTIVVNGSVAAATAVLVSLVPATLALRWPTSVRRLTIIGLAGSVLLAPLLAAIPARLHAEFSESLPSGSLSVLDLDQRAAKWEFARRLVKLKPLEGWGFGASANLPGRELSIENALGAASVKAGSPTARSFALAGGHPHNAALLTWLDLGLVGALLVAGLIAAVGRSIARVEADRGTHAALLGLIAVSATYLVFNYPAWEPEVMSILWMTAVLAAAVLPEAVVTQRALLRSGAAVLLILALGCSVLVYGRASRWWTAREIREGGVVLDGETGRLGVGGETRPLEYSVRLDAGAELLDPGPGGPP
jgi:O-antigen ligase